MQSKRELIRIQDSRNGVRAQDGFRVTIPASALQGRRSPREPTGCSFPIRETPLQPQAGGRSHPLAPAGNGRHGRARQDGWQLPRPPLPHHHNLNHRDSNQLDFCPSDACHSRVSRPRLLQRLFFSAAAPPTPPWTQGFGSSRVQSPSTLAPRPDHRAP